MMPMSGPPSTRPRTGTPRRSSPQIVRRTTAALTLVAIGTNALGLPDYFGSSHLVGSFAVAHICGYLFAMVLLRRSDSITGWGTTLYVAAIPAIDIPIRNAVGYALMSPSFVDRWSILDLIQVSNALALTAVAGAVLIRHAGSGPVVAMAAYLILHGTYTALIPAVIHNAAPLAIAQTFIGFACLFGAGLVLTGSTTVWVTTFAIGAVTITGHVLGISAGTPMTATTTQPGWQTISLVNALAGIALICVASPVLRTRLRQTLAQRREDALE